MLQWLPGFYENSGKWIRPGLRQAGAGSATAGFGSDLQQFVVFLAWNAASCHTQKQAIKTVAGSIQEIDFLMLIGVMAGGLAPVSRVKVVPGCRF